VTLDQPTDDAEVLAKANLIFEKHLVALWREEKPAICGYT
jgi:hypothetical protein